MHVLQTKVENVGEIRVWLLTAYCTYSKRVDKGEIRLKFFMAIFGFVPGPQSSAFTLMVGLRASE
jgi:hypothetical protein